MTGYAPAIANSEQRTANKFYKRVKLVCCLLMGFICFCPKDSKSQTTYTWWGLGVAGLWTDPDNWDQMSGYPGATDNVIIGDPANPSSDYPIITGTTYSCHDITFVDGGHLEFAAAGSRLNVRGDFDNQTGVEEILDNQGIIQFDDDDEYQQQVFGRTTFNEVIMSKTALNPFVTLRDRTTIRVRLVPTIGKFESNGYLTLAANYNSGFNTAYIKGVSSVNSLVLGEVTVQQSIEQGYKCYHFLCSPVTIDDSDLYTLTDQYSDNTNDFSHNSSYAYPGSPIPDFMHYDETEYGTTNNLRMWGWEGISTSYQIQPGEGICAKFEADITTGYIDWVGWVNNGNITTPTLTYTGNSQPTLDGINLIGNPYPSPLDWAEYYADQSSGVTDYLSPIIWIWYGNNSSDPLDGFFYIFDADGSYSPTNPDQLNGTGVLAIGQGFQVQVDHNMTLTFENAHRAESNTVDFRRNKKPENTVFLKLEGSHNQDYLTLAWDENFKDEFEFGKDAGKMINPGNNFYAMAGSEKLMLDRVKSPTTQSIIPLGLDLAEGGVYNFVWENGDIDEANFIVYFQDKEKNVLIPVSESFSYQFNGKDGENKERFYLIIKSKYAVETIEPNGRTAYALINSETLFLQSGTVLTGQVEVNLLNANGSLIASEIGQSFNGKIEMSIPNLPQGIYFARINQTETIKVVK